MTQSVRRDVVSIYVTVGSRDEACRIARILVAEKLVACANVFDPVTSVFRWNNAVEEEAESVLIAKTPADSVDRVKARLLEIHPYECPCVVVWPIVDGHEPYLEWVRAECAP